MACIVQLGKPALHSRHQAVKNIGSWPLIPEALTDGTEEARAVVEDHMLSAHVWRSQEERLSAPFTEVSVMQAGGRAP